MANDTLNIEHDETQLQNFPPSPPRIRKEHSNILGNKRNAASGDHLDQLTTTQRNDTTLTKPVSDEPSRESFINHASSHVSGYDERTRQMITAKEYQYSHGRGRHERLSSFVSSSSSNTAFDRGVLPTAQSLNFDSSPEKDQIRTREYLQDDEDYLHESDVHDEQVSRPELEADAAPMSKCISDDHACENSKSYFGNRPRTESDDFYLLMTAESQNHSGMKFYESDIDSVNGSVVYKRNSWKKKVTDARDQSSPLSSVGLTGSDVDAMRAQNLPATRQSTPSRNVGTVHSFPTPQLGNLSKNRESTKKGNVYDDDDEEGTDFGGHMNAIDLSALPYQARKQLKQTNRELDYNSNDVYGNYEPSKLSTIAAPYLQKTSPTYGYSSGLPPSGPRRSRTLSKDSNHGGVEENLQNQRTKNMNSQQCDENEVEVPSTKIIPRPPPLHFRMESSGSVSSLGSTMDGASSVAQQETERLTRKLQRDIQEYHDDNNDSEYLPSRASSGKRSGKESRGFLSHLVDSMSFTSAGSFRSVEDERADYLRKGSKILKKAENLKKKSKSGSYEWLPDRIGERISIRSVSPANRSQRSHRPRLPSIDNDTWEEDDEEEDDENEGAKESKQYRRPTIQKKRGKHSGKPPTRNKTVSTNYGSMKHAKDYKPIDRQVRNVEDRDKRKSESAWVQTTHKYSDESFQSSDDSCISSDSMTHQFSEDGEDSSVYVDENGILSDDCLSLENENNERSSLLPSGIKTYESGNPRRTFAGGPLSNDQRVNQSAKKKRQPRDSKGKSRHSGRKRKNYRRDRGRPFSDYDPYRDDKSSSSSPDYRQYDRRNKKSFYEKERRKMENRIRKQMMKEFEEQQCCNRFSRWSKAMFKSFWKYILDVRYQTETFIGNLPLTIGAIGLAIVTLGVVWFKFAEVMLNSCFPVHFHSNQCHFSEFPGCFYCDTNVRAYKLANGFHQACSAIAGAIAFLFMLKICIARKVVIDEMNSPTTSSPAGLICMTIVCVAAGKGMMGQVLVTCAAAVHLCVAVWFILMAGSFNILPDPSWYPNTVGLGVSAVKTWLYYPMAGHFLMLISLSFFSFFFPISLVRVTLNQKISAPVAWIQMSAPAVSLYAMTIMAQPSFEEEYPDLREYQRIHRVIYLPCMHVLFVTAVLGAISSVQSLYTRWDSFRNVKFSPAHAAFCFPTLAHANAVQAYRSAVNSFSALPTKSIPRILLDIYWLAVLIGGTTVTVVITIKFFYRLPDWTSVNLEGEHEPPAPNETLMSEVVRVGETWRQNYVSPVVLQANEAGALVQVRQNGRTKYVRTRRVTALGFEPIMDMIDFTNERETLLEWVERNPPRTRKRTMSVPGFGIYLGDFGSHNRGVYTGGSGYLPTHHTTSMSTDSNNNSSERRQRAQTLL